MNLKRSFLNNGISNVNKIFNYQHLMICGLLILISLHITQQHAVFNFPKGTIETQFNLIISFLTFAINHYIKFIVILETVDLLSFANTSSLKPSYSNCYFKYSRGVNNRLTQDDDLEKKDVVDNLNKSGIIIDKDNRRHGFRFLKNSQITVPTNQIYFGKNTISISKVLYYNHLPNLYKYLLDEIFPNNFAILATFRIRENSMANLFTLYDSSMKEILFVQIGNDLELFYYNTTYKLSDYEQHKTNFNDG